MSYLYLKIFFREFLVTSRREKAQEKVQTVAEGGRDVQSPNCCGINSEYLQNSSQPIQAIFEEYKAELHQFFISVVRVLLRQTPPKLSLHSIIGSDLSSLCSHIFSSAKFLQIIVLMQKSNNRQSRYFPGGNLVTRLVVSPSSLFFKLCIYKKLL